MRILYPDTPIPNDLNEPHDGTSDQEDCSIFLVGPSLRSPGITPWRVEALRILQEDLDYQGTVLIPETPATAPSTYNTDSFNYQNQVEWEFEGLKYCTAIAAWVPRDLKTLPAFTTNVEFGLHVREEKFFYGRPNGAPKTQYLDWLYSSKEANFGYRGVDKPSTTLKGLLQEVVTWLSI